MVHPSPSVILWHASLVTALAVSAACAGESAVPYLDPDSGLWGYVDKEGALRISPKYQQCEPFLDGLAPVRVQSQWGYINEAGVLVITNVFREAGDFHEGYAMVRSRHGLCGFIDKKGNQVIPCEYRWAGDFSEGLAPVYPDNTRAYCINHEGTVVFSVDFHGYGRREVRFHHGLSPFLDARGLLGYMDTTGAVIIGPRFYFAGRFAEGLAAVAVEQGDQVKWGYISPSGAWAISPRYEVAHDFRSGVALVAKNAREGSLVSIEYGFISTTGVFITNSPDLPAKAPRTWGPEGFREPVGAEWHDLNINSNLMDRTWDHVIGFLSKRFGVARKTSHEVETHWSYHRNKAYVDSYRTRVRVLKAAGKIRIACPAEYRPSEWWISGFDINLCEEVSRLVESLGVSPMPSNLRQGAAGSGATDKGAIQ